MVCEGFVFNATKNAKKPALMQISVYYTFNIKYQTLLLAVLIISIPYLIYTEKKLPILVVNLSSSLMKLQMEQ